MSNRHQILKDARKAGTARTEKDQTFKNPFQTVVRAKTVGHNMHDDFVHNPPKNIVEDDIWPHSGLKWPLQSGVPEQELGRIKRTDVEGGLVEENSVHSQSMPEDIGE